MANRRLSRHKRIKRLQKHRKIRQNLKLTFNLNNAKKHIKNFSNHTLSVYETLALGKGLKFVPYHLNKNWKTKLLLDFNQLCRKMRCKYELDDGMSAPLHPFYVHSKYKPPPANNAIEAYIFTTKMELDNIFENTKFSNFSKSEWLAIKSLQNRTDIIIKKADKNSTVVLMNKHSYIQEGKRQLSGIHYEQIHTTNSDMISKEVNTLVETLKNTNQIDKMTYKFLSNKKAHNKCGRLYMLPKIHKLPENITNNIDNLPNKSNIVIPGRPIVSQCGVPTEGIGKLLDYFLLPAVKRQSTFIKDSTEMLNILENLKCPANIILCSYDLSSMYTNMHIEELISVLTKTYDQLIPDDYEIPLIKKNNFIDIVKKVLQTNEFVFAEETYIQRIGCAMGAKPSGQICDVRAFEFINCILNQFPYRENIILHKRFKDDGLIIFNNSLTKLQEFFQLANNAHNLLKFTFEYSQNSIDFLDITIYKGQRFHSTGILDTKSFIKKTETHQYLHRTSLHPTSVFKGFIKGETLRHIRLNSEQNNLNKSLYNFEKKLLERGYSKTEIKTAMNEAKVNSRIELIKSSKLDSNCRETPLTLVTLYYPFLRRLSKTLRTHWSLIANDPDANQVFKRPPIVAFKRHKNIGNFVTSSTVKK